MKALLHCGNCHCFRTSGGRNDREKPTGGCITVVVIGQLHMSICDSIGSNNNGKGMFRVVEQALVGRDRRTQRTAAQEATSKAAAAIKSINV